MTSEAGKTDKGSAVNFKGWHAVADSLFSLWRG